MGRFIIDIKDDIPETVALACVSAVIKEGKTSEGEHGKKYYCWATIFDTSVGKVVVNTRQYRKNPCFLVYKDKRNI